MAKYLDNSGLATVFSIIKQHLPKKTSDLTNDSGFLTSSDAVTSFNGSTGDVTYTAPVTSVNGATGAVSLDADDIPYNGSQSVYEKIDDIVTQGGEPNVIETVEQNGVPLTVTNKTVDVTVPTKTSDLVNDSDFITLTDVPVTAVSYSNHTLFIANAVVNGDGEQY